jgi:cation diffusion facilitator family transporter
MTPYELDKWLHRHDFHQANKQGERNTRRVIVLTLTTMGLEIVTGYISGSMALLADGWHMGTHAVALGITLLAYRFAQRHADNPLYSFGTGKVGVLGGFTSAVVLALVALFMAAESTKRLYAPVAIHFNEAIVVALIGLAVNLISAFLLQYHSHHDHGLGANHHTLPHDHNLKSAYFHVLADALTSVLAIVALFTGKALGWIWMDPVMGVVGAVIIARWAYSLLRDTSKILLDRDVDLATVTQIYDRIESNANAKITDIHIWRIGSGQLAGIISILTPDPKAPEFYKELLTDFKDLVHLTVEVNRLE